MANAPIPPLFCSTPPPIDENEDFGAYQENISDDEFDDFHSGTPQIYDNIKSNANNEMLEKNIFPTTNIPLENCDLKTNIQNNTPDIEFSKHSDDLEKDLSKSNCESDLKHHNNTTSLSSLSEQTSSISTQSDSPPPNVENGIIDDDDDDDKEFGEFQYDMSSELAKSDSGRSTENDEVADTQGMHETEKEKCKKSPTLSNIVVLEDIIDDSSDDERHSPKNRNNFVDCDENSNDFFSIQPVEDLDKESITEKAKSADTEPQLLTEHIPQSNTVNISAKSHHETEKECSQNSKTIEADFEGHQKVEVSCSNPLKDEDEEVNNDDDDEDDFATFKDFTTETDVQSEWASKCENPIEEDSVEYLSTTSELTDKQNDRKEEVENDTEANNEDDLADDDFDDDDFGDFSVAPIQTTPSQAPITHQQPTTVLKENLATHLKPVLEIMFPNDAVPNEDIEVPKPNTSSLKTPRMELAFVESAKALDYQWVGSTVRHALIRSLGIDSRNIFLTEKWNSSMPRFAANLSFDPLQPLKPTSATLQPEIVSNSTHTTKTDVPVAEFDWKSSGLVNPLDASHVHTLLLDVDQLVVVANLDNINLDSSSSCSQSSPSRALTANSSSSSMQINKNHYSGLTPASTNKTSTTTTTTSTTTISIEKSKMDRKSNGTILNAFHGDNLQMNSTDYASTLMCTDDTFNAFNTTNRIIDLHDTTTGYALLSPTGVVAPSNNCNIYHMHNHNYNNKNIININNNNANTSHDAFNTIDTMCFDASITTASNVLLPTTSVAFTNHLQFNNNNLHHSMAAPTSTSSTSTFNITPLTTTTITTTNTSTTTTTFTEFTNIAHHFEQNQNRMQILKPMMSASECIKMKQYREFRPQAEMAARPLDAANAEPSPSGSHNENDGDTSSASSHTSAETPAVVASATGATLPPIATGSGHVDSANNDLGNNIDIGLYDVLSVKSSTQVPIEVTCNESNELELEPNTVVSHKDESLDTMSYNTTTETKISLEENVEVHIDNGVISRSTYSGPLKETHIFTPAKNGPDSNEKAVALTRNVTPTTIGSINSKTFPIDFDYEKAAAGIIIDETVVRKEYRDIEYNPGFNLETNDTQTIESSVALQPLSTLSQQTLKTTSQEEADDEFTDFQSVPAPEPTTRTATPKLDRLQAPVDGMILSPAILLPQAISMTSKQPKIEWGDSAASINPEELARIEELFPQDTSVRNDSRKSTPTHTVGIHHNSLSISASIASQSKQQLQDQHDDDDWSDFVSVTVPVSTSRHLPMTSQQRSPQKLPSNSNDDEWSDFVSSTPNTHGAVTNFRASPAPNSSYGMPQFNSASWQNANFYNNPLSIYHRNQANVVPNATPTKFQNNNYTSHNNNNSNNNIHNNHSSYTNNSNNNNFTQYLSNYQQQTTQKLQPQQQIQIMQDFSTAASVPPYRPNIPPSHQAYMQSNYPSSTSTTGPSHFQVGSAKIAPTVSLIPDLGFVAPAMPMHTAIINALPKPAGAGVKK